MTKTTKTHFKNFFILLFMVQGVWLLGQIDNVGNPDNSIQWTQNNFMIVYSEDATDEEMAALRATYHVTAFDAINLGGKTVDIWTLTFPFNISDDAGGIIVITDVVELGEALGINPDGAGVGDEESIVSGGNLDFVIEMDSVYNSVPYGLPAVNPVPECIEHSYRIDGDPVVSNPNNLEIIILDQLINDPVYFSNLHPTKGLVPANDNLGGNHGTMVASIIQNTLGLAGVTDYKLTSLGVFDINGNANYVDIIRAFELLHNSGVQDAIINMSASVFVEDPASFTFDNIFWDVIGEYLVDNNILFVSSGGNSGFTHSYDQIGIGGGTDGAESYMYYLSNYNPDEAEVFPGCADLTNEITVAGLQECYHSLSTFSGGNNEHFEISAESEDILVWNGLGYFLEDGVSFATPLVTAAAAQVNAELVSFDATLIKNRLLNYADQNGKLAFYVEDGRILNVSASIDADGGMPQSQGLRSTSSSEVNAAVVSKTTIHEPSIVVSPNPFHNYLNINLSEFPPQAIVSLQLFDFTGRLVAQKELATSENLQWNITASIPSGGYWLQIMSGDKVISEKVVKI